MGNAVREQGHNEGPSPSAMAEASLRRLELDFSPDNIERIAEKWAPHYAPMDRTSVDDAKRRLVQDLQEHVRLVRLAHAQEKEGAEIDVLLNTARLSQEIAKRRHEAYFDGRQDPYANTGTTFCARAQETKDAVNGTLGGRKTGGIVGGA